MPYINKEIIKLRFKQQKMFEFGYETSLEDHYQYNSICYGDNWQGKYGAEYLRTIAFWDNLGDFERDVDYKAIIKYEYKNRNSEITARYIIYTEKFFIPKTEEEFDEFINSIMKHPNEIDSPF